MNNKRKELLDIASIYLKASSFFNMFAAASEYFDSMSWKYRDLSNENFPAFFLVVSSDLESIIHNGQKPLCHITKIFEERLKAIFKESTDIQIDVLGALFCIEDFDAFMEILIDNTPTYIAPNDDELSSILSDWVSRSYSQYQNENT